MKGIERTIMLLVLVIGGSVAMVEALPPAYQNYGIAGAFFLLAVVYAALTGSRRYF